MVRRGLCLCDAAGQDWGTFDCENGRSENGIGNVLLELSENGKETAVDGGDSLSHRLWCKYFWRENGSAKCLGSHGFPDWESVHPDDHGHGNQKRQALA